MKRLFAVALLLLPLLSEQNSAQTVYKTVEDGVTTFSDSPPETGSAEVMTIDVPSAAEDGALEERLAAMRDTTDRMASDRREREKHRAKLRDLQQSATVQSTAAQPASGSVTTGWQNSYWPGYGRPLLPRPRPPIRPGRPVRPTPVPQPRSVPGWSVMQPGNSQLMRPIVSSRR
ncbi:DUF4124 domain-containing protein [Congregibacter sp.]|uniref:DUF4124 domain-containing protein n=1 Tax=Congregibacter sp. TaxID=2744308 RepID=UPI003F6B63F0